MHKWSASIIAPDGRSFKGRAKLVSERLVSVRGHEVVSPNTNCRVGIVLPEQPGGDVLRQVDIQCSVAQVVFGSNDIRLVMNVKSVPSADREIFLESSGKTKK
jgi:hypothetical protein